MNRPHGIVNCTTGSKLSLSRGGSGSYPLKWLELSTQVVTETMADFSSVVVDMVFSSVMVDMVFTGGVDMSAV
jgi:hypothetical protein